MGLRNIIKIKTINRGVNREMSINREELNIDEEYFVVDYPFIYKTRLQSVDAELGICRYIVKGKEKIATFLDVYKLTDYNKMEVDCLRS